MIYKIAFSVSVMSFFVMLFSAQIATPGNLMLRKADWVVGISALTFLLSFATGLVAYLWGV